MPPNLRSATNTPTSKKKAAMKTATAAASPSPRKAPHCRTCGKPRAGHPRAGCPSSAQQEDAANEMVQAMQKMELKPSSPTPKRRINTRADPDTAASPINSPSTARRHRRSSIKPLSPTKSLVSLSFSSEELVERLLQPGMLSSTSEDTEEPQAKIQKWRRATLMIPVDEDEGLDQEPSSYKTPGTPTTSTSLKHDSAPEEKAAYNKPPRRSMIPLARSMTMDEQAEFLSTFNKNENSVHVKNISIADVDNVIADASKARLFTHTIPLPGQPQVVLLIGRVQSEVASVAKAMSSSGEKKGSAIRVAAAGMFAGAAATWTGLAYS